MEKKKKRDYKIDALRAIGLIAIIFAHSGPPNLLFQLRNFDVPLMVLLSGSVLHLSSTASGSKIRYFFKRVSNLLIPTWSILTLYFLIALTYSYYTNTPFPYATKTIISSYTLNEGIGYVWIMRVFILLAIITPTISALYNKLNPKKFLVLLAGTFLVYEILFYLYSFTSLNTYYSLDLFIQKIIFYILPFTVIAGLGIYIRDFNHKKLWIISTIFSTIFISFVIYFVIIGHLLSTQSYKYPPQLYYISYALFVSALLYLSSTTQFFSRFFNNKIIIFLGSSTIWIYLWHIIVLEIFNISNFSPPYFIKFLLVLILSTIIAYFQFFLKKLFKNLKPLPSPFVNG